jgi:hypothetical protein
VVNRTTSSRPARKIEYTDDDWLPVAFVSGLLAISEKTLRRWYARGRLPGRRQQRDKRFLGVGRPVLHMRIKDVLGTPPKE